MTTPLAAANAYASLARLQSIGGATPGAGEAAAGPSFTSLLKDAVGAVTDAGRKADMQSQTMAAGKANLIDVVTAVSESEVAVGALVSVRDKVIQAYEEIMRMPI